MPLYLSNTNRLESLQGGVLRGLYSASVQPIITASYFNGLGRTQYSPGFGAQGAPAYTPASFTGSAYVSGSTIVNSGSLQPTFLQPGTIYTGSAQWLGYFLPTTTETYSFYLTSDDQSTLWLGAAATASLALTSSALLNLTSGQTLTGSISLTSGSYYPMRLQYSAQADPDYFTASFSTPTITKTTNFTGYTYCNTASLGF